MHIIDFHSHILPGIDDGSRSVNRTIEMLRISAEQGVHTMIATPHFYADRDRMDDFLDRREVSYHKVKEGLKKVDSAPLPQIKIGAEVAFFHGISQADRISDLTIGDSNLFLLEMPFGPWTQSYVREVRDMIYSRDIKVILAHIERYLPMRDNRKYIDELLELPVYVQINAESLTDWKQRRKLLKMFKQGQAHLLGSDCHGITQRVPNLNLGREVIAKKLGQDALDQIDRLGSKLLSKM